MKGRDIAQKPLVETVRDVIIPPGFPFNLDGKLGSVPITGPGNVVIEGRRYHCYEGMIDMGLNVPPGAEAFSVFDDGLVLHVFYEHKAAQSSLGQMYPGKDIFIAFSHETKPHDEGLKIALLYAHRG